MWCLPTNARLRPESDAAACLNGCAIWHWPFYSITPPTSPSIQLPVVLLTSPICPCDRLSSGGGAARAKDAQGTSDQIHTSPSVLVYEDSYPESYITKYTSIRRKSEIPVTRPPGRPGSYMKRLLYQNFMEMKFTIQHVLY